MAGGAYCSATWKPESPDLGCASQITIAPGNDSRINLFLLVQDRAGQNGAGLAYPDLGWESFFGRNFMRWRDLRNAWYPPVERTDWPDHFGTRCQTLESGFAQFSGALAKQNAIKPEQTSFFQNSRISMAKLCDEGPQALTPGGSGGYFAGPLEYGASGTAPGAFLNYLEGSASFYAGDWDRASALYAELASGGGDEWVRETALYMAARTALNEAIESGEDEWGFFDPDILKTGPAKRAEQGFEAYIAAYPDGRYAASAKGLIRKSLWLQRNYTALGPLYQAMLDQSDPADSSTGDLIEEVDDKFLVRDGRQIGSEVLLLAVDDLMRMRRPTWTEDLPDNLLSSGELDAQASSFASHPELYSFLKANHAFYVAGDHRAVLKLIPDDARKDSYTPLAFSRQYLRGLALHALEDKNEAGFWLELIGGAKGIWQRPAVELALARNYEKTGRIDQIFAKDSPITDGRMRRIVLGNSAGPDILKAQARDEGQSAGERGFALFTVLVKQLQNGSYAGFLQDYPLAAQFDDPGDEERYGLWGIYDLGTAPNDLFTRGTWSDGYECPAIQKTAQLLARNSADVKGRLCLGDFYRLNGLDDFSFGNEVNDGADESADVLGTSNFYPSKANVRHDFYTSIISDSRASSDERAYALYRAIRCYAPSNNNGCGGPGVKEGQRASWFRQLKRQYGGTKWAQELDYYW